MNHHHVITAGDLYLDSLISFVLGMCFGLLSRGRRR